MIWKDQDRMETEEIKKILIGKQKVIFGPKDSPKTPIGSYMGMPYITIDLKNKTLEFTSDTLDYLMSKKLEDALELLFSKFIITRYNINIHIHPGNNHDKNIILLLKDTSSTKYSEKIPEIIKFIQDNFYKKCEWNFGLGN